MKVDTRFGLVLTVGLFASVSFVLAQSKATTGPTVKPTAVITKTTTTTITAPSGAKATKTAGANKAVVSTANSATDDDSFWIEKLDVDGDGDVEDSNLVWDDEDKVLFVYTVGAFTCKNGGTATSELLVATNGAGNTRGRPAGSGFWVADVDKGECGSQSAALWGCKFDATGTETACGLATIDDKTDDIVIVTASK